VSVPVTELPLLESVPVMDCGGALGVVEEMAANFHEPVTVG